MAKHSPRFLQIVAEAKRRGKPEIIETLSIAAGYLGLSGIYLEAGSGARLPVTAEEIAAAAGASNLPVLVGGGVDSAAQINALLHAGARGIVIGTALERTRTAEWICI